MKFWDASAIVPLLVAEGATRSLQALASSRFGPAGLVGIAGGMRLGARPTGAQRFT